MREPLTTYLAVAALAVFVAWHWVAPSEQPVAPPGADATAVVAVPVEPEVPDRRTASDAVPAQRTEPGTGLGSVRGRIVDQLLQPIAGARAQLVLGEQTEGLPSAQTDGDGRFLVVGVPLTVCALRAEAPGRMPVQLGDLHPENLPDHDVDAGTFVLAPATSHHGQVRSRGRGLPGARVVLAPELGPPGRPVPVVQVTNTDEEGHFHFAVAPMPPSHLRATAAGHREAPVQKVTDPQQPIVVELTPLARCNGRVVDRATGETKVRRFYALDDCGTRINPMIIDGQIHGGLTEGFAVAMGQQMPFDAQGNLLGNTLMDYFLPTAVETPKWETDHTVTPSPHHPIGAKGVAESPHVGSIPTFTAAVVDAFAHVGVTHLDMPHTSFRVWKSLKEHNLAL